MQIEADSEDLSRFSRSLARPGFDYADMAPGEVAKAKAAAEWVRGTYRALEATTLEAFAEIGERLLEARETVGHGRFMAWVKSECDGISHSTALRMMDVAKNIGLAHIPHVVNLPRALVYEVAADSTPPAIRAEVMAKAEAGEPIYSGTVLLTIKAARMRAQNAKRRARNRVTPATARTVELAKAREAKRQAALEVQRIEAAERGQRLAAIILARLTGEDRAAIAALIPAGDGRYSVLQRMGESLAAEVVLSVPASLSKD